MAVLEIITPIITPLRDQVLCKLIVPTEAVSKGGLFLPSPITAKGCRLGRVVAIGDGKLFGKDDTLDINLEKDDVIILNEHSGQTITYGTDSWILVAYSEVFGRWDNWDQLGEE